MPRKKTRHPTSSVEVQPRRPLAPTPLPVTLDGMKPRARRVTIAAAVLGAGVVGVLMVVSGPVRDHVDAWHFQLTRETKMIEPNPEMPGCMWSDWGDGKTVVYILMYRGVLECLAAHSCIPVIAYSPESHHASGVETLVWKPEHAPFSRDSISEPDLLRILRSRRGIRVLEQRFPRRAYVVIHDEGATP
jgi:hypothetical protein